MPEVQQRPPPPPRGRGGSSRGGRSGGSFGTRGGAGRISRTNGDNASFEDQGEIGMLKRQYSEQLKSLREIISNWTDEDLVLALQENGGDVNQAATSITDGHVAQFSEVKKKSKDRARTKPNESATNDSTTVAGRATRGRGISEAPRGGRGGRGADRGGRVAGRGRGGTGANGHKSKDSTDEAGDNAAGDDSIDPIKADADRVATSGLNSTGPKPGPEPKKPAATPWANLFKSAPVPVVKKSPPPPAPPTQQPSTQQQQPPTQQQQPPTQQPPAPQQQEKPPSPPPKEEEPEAQPEPEPELPSTPPVIEPAVPEQEEPALPKPATPPEPAELEAPAVPEIRTEELVDEPSHQQPLTEKNLEQIEDAAPPAPTGTQASTANTSVPARTETTQIAPSTPQPRPATIGLPTPSHKISSGRTSSFTRRTLDQQEPVIMPGNHAVDRTIVQFGSLGLNGSMDDLDMDDEKEEPEPISQPAVPSPLPQPVATLPVTTPQVSLPPQSQQPQPQTVSESLPTPRQAPGLPAQPQMQSQIQHQTSPQPPLAPQNMNLQHQQQQQQPLSNRFAAAEPAQQAQKAYDSFQHLPQQQQQHTPQTQAAQLPQQVPPVQPQQSQQQQSYGYTPASYTQHHQQAHQQTHPSQVGLSGVSDQYQNYYTSDLQRVGGAPGLNYYSNPYSQPSQEAVASLPRAGSGLGTSADIPSQLPTASAQAQQAASRFVAAQAVEQAGGHGTPSPGIPAPPSSQAPQPQQTAAHQQYPMQPYYHPGYYYMNQVFNYETPYSRSHELSGDYVSPQQFYPYQTPFGSKQQGVYSQPHQSFTPQYAEHTSSLTGLSGFGGPSSQGRETATGLNDYGRAAAVSQAQQSHPQHASANFGGLPNFLNSRGLPEQQQLGTGVGQQQGGQQGQSEDNLKAFGDSKPPTGPASNPSLQGQPRPGSATSGAANMGPQQSAQQHASMGYPTHLNHLQGHHQQQQPQHSAGAAQGYNQYSMYGQYPSQYGQTNSRQTGGGSWGQYGH